MRILICLVLLSALPVPGDALAQDEFQVRVASGGWELVGDLRLPTATDPVPAVLLLNQAAGDRTPYRELAGHLADRGIASLRLDLRGHGESTNLGAFAPGERARDPMIWDAQPDITAAVAFLRGHAGVDASRIAIVGASYSGEEMAEAGRLDGYAEAYVALSPGSFSDESIAGIDASGVPWLFVVTNRERHLTEITAAVHETSETVELVIAPGTEHATDILGAHPSMSERIAVWLRERLSAEDR